MDFSFAQELSDGVLFFLKYPLLILLYLFVFMALRAMLRSLPSKEQLRRLGANSKTEYVAHASSVTEWSSDTDHIAFGFTQDSLPAVSAVPNPQMTAKTKQLKRTQVRTPQQEQAIPTVASHVKLTDLANSREPQLVTASLEGPQNKSTSAYPSVQKPLPQCSYLELVSGLDLADPIVPIERELLFGRRSDCDIVLTDSFASGRHAKIIPTANGDVLEDLNSCNGTFCGDMELKTPYLLRDGDLISISDGVFRYHKGR